AMARRERHVAAEVHQGRGALIARFGHAPMLPRYRMRAAVVHTAMAADQVLVDIADDLATVTLNRPERRNSLSESMLLDLGAALQRAIEPPGVRAVIIAAAGPVFSAGHDFGDMIERDLDGMRRLLSVCTELMLGLARLPVPVVACVQGIATAAGCQL